MARNPTKNLYITIGIPRDSGLLAKLQRDSKESGTSLAKLIPVKLDALYSGGVPVAVKEPDITIVKPVQSAEANASAFLDSEED